LKKTNPSSSSKANNVAGEQFLYLTTQGRKSGLRREIEIWFTERDGHFYVIAEYETSHWLQNLRAHPEVKVRIAGANLPARARVVSPALEPDLHRAVQELSRRKYSWGDGVVVELSPTSPVEKP
jgi:deazaflavin-dependent oxidoreductase (nitroreductase family)